MSLSSFGPLRRVSPAAWLFAFAICLTVLAFWQSILRLAPFVGVETAVGLVPAIPFLIAWIVWFTARQRARQGLPVVGVREPALDYPLAAALLGIAAWLMWSIPAMDGWYFWARRLDMLGLAVFMLGIAVFLWGLQSLLWYRLAVVYTLLLWPDTLVRIQDALAVPMAYVTALAARPIVLGLGVPLEPVQDPSVFVSAGPVHWGIIIGDVCSGLNAVLSVLLVAIPATQFFGLRWRQALPWLGTGVALAILSNILRVVILFAASELFGSGFALRTLHPVLGAILLMAVFAYLWIKAPTPAAVPAPRPAAPGKIARLTWRTGIVVALIAGSFSVASARITAFEPLPPIGPPSGPLDEPLDYIQLPGGWTFRALSELAWQNLFGSSSHSYAMSFVSGQGALAKAQLVVTRDRDRLRAFTLENCRIYHGNDVVGTRTVDLGSGGSAFLLDVWDQTFQGAGRFSVLYWEAPVKLQGQDAHVRFALFAMDADRATFPPTAQTGIAPGGAEFDAGDALLIGLARQITAELVHDANAARAP